MNHTKAKAAAPPAYSIKNESPFGDNTKSAIANIKLMNDTNTGFFMLLFYYYGVKIGHVDPKPKKQSMNGQFIR